MSKEAMKLALEALENSRSLEPVDVQWVKGKRHAAITALREALEEQPAQQQERLTKAEQRMVHDFPHLAQFHAKHALGPMLPPSCLCCGHQTNPITHPVAVQHMELPGVVICKSCHDAALAQPQQEPVAFPTRRSVEREIERTANPTGMHLNDGKERVTLPGGTLRHMLALIDRTSPPAQRTWVGLSDEEKRQLFDREDYQGWLDYINAIEAKLKEKNT